MLKFIADICNQRMDALIDQWSDWRDAQTCDYTKTFVDECFTREIWCLDMFTRYDR